MLVIRRFVVGMAMQSNLEIMTMIVMVPVVKMLVDGNRDSRHSRHAPQK